MSLINQVLIDLEKRRAAEIGPGNELLAQVRPTARRGGSALRVVGGIGAILLLAGIVLTAAALRSESPAPEGAPLQTAMANAGTAAEPATPVSPPPLPAHGTLKLDAPKSSPAPTPVAGGEEIETMVENSNAGHVSRADTGGTDRPAPVVTGSDLGGPVEPRAAAKAAGATGAALSPANPVTVKGETFRVARPASAAEEIERELRHGREAMAAGRLAGAEAPLRRVLALQPGHLHGRELLAELFQRQGRAAEAEDVLRQGVQQSPSHLPFVKGYARLLAGRGAWDEADSVLGRVDAPPPAVDPDYHALLAAIRQRFGDFSAAADIYRQLVRLRPDNGSWWIGLGIALEAGENSGEAEAAYLHGLKAGGASAELAAYARRRLAALGY